MKDSKRNDDCYFPPDMAAILFPSAPILGFLLLDFWLTTARRGNTSLFSFALVLAAIGAVLLFFARLPLYRDRRFFAIGPKALTGVHRQLYRWAYSCLVVSIVLLGLLIWAVR